MSDFVICACVCAWLFSPVAFEVWAMVQERNRRNGRRAE